MCQCHHIKTHAHPRMLREGQAVAAGFASLPGQPKPWSENIAEIVYSYMMITPNFVQSRLFFNCAFSCVDRFSQMKRSTVRRFLPVRQAPQYPKDAQFGLLALSKATVGSSIQVPMLFSSFMLPFWTFDKPGTHGLHNSHRH